MAASSDRSSRRLVPAGRLVGVDRPASDSMACPYTRYDQVPFNNIASAEAVQQFLGDADDPFAVGADESDPGAPVDDVLDGQGPLVGDRILEFRTRDVDSVGDGFGRPLAGGGGEYVGRFRSVPQHQ